MYMTQQNSPENENVLRVENESVIKAYFRLQKYFFVLLIVNN